MSKRINYLIKQERDSEIICAVLYSDSCHPKIDTKQIVENLADNSIGANHFMSQLMDIKYPSTVGNNIEGEPVFVFASACDDHDELLLVFWDYSDEDSPARVLNCDSLSDAYKATDY